MSSGTLISRILGMVRDMLLASVFSRTVTDAFFVAFRLPNLFRRLLGEGALSASFLPIYVDQLVGRPGETEGDIKERACRLANGIYSLLFWTVSLLTVFGILYMDRVMGLFVSGEGYQVVIGKVELTVRLARLMFIYLFLVTQYAFLMSIMNAHKKFLWPALGPAFYNATFIMFICMSPTWFPQHGDNLAYGVVAGGFVQVLFVFIPLWKMGYLPKLKLRWKSEASVRVLKNMVPGLVGMGVLQLLNIVNVNFSSRFAEGTHTHIFLADRLLELPQSIIAISLGAALLPTLSELWTKEKRSEMIAVGRRHTQILFFLVLPSAAGLFFLAQPIVQVLFMRGSFSHQDVEQTVEILKLYSLLLVFLGVYKVTIPSFYAIKNTWIPAAVATAGLLFHILVAPLLMDRMGLPGLIISMVLSGFINLVLLIGAYYLMIGKWGLLENLKSLLHNLPALTVMSVVIHYGFPFLFEKLDMILMTGLSRLITLSVMITLGVITYFSVSIFVRQEVASEVATLLKRKLRRGRN